MFRFLLFTLLASFRLATSMPASTGVGEGIIEWIKQLVQDATSDWSRCTILKADDYPTYYSLTRYNTAEVSCQSSSLALKLDRSHRT